VRIVVASEARDDLVAAVGYIAKHNPTAAARFVEPLCLTQEALADRLSERDERDGRAGKE